jgi:hypothetical protein
MNTFQRNFSGLFIIISIFGIIITLKNLGMTESQYYGIENDKWKTTFGELVTGIFIWGTLLQSFVYFILFFYHLYYALKYKIKQSYSLVKIFCLAATLISIWVVITIQVNDNGHHDYYWGPADTGLFFICCSSLVVNYLIFTIIYTNKLVSPKALYNIWNEKGLN